MIAENRKNTKNECCMGSSAGMRQVGLSTSIKEMLVNIVMSFECSRKKIIGKPCEGEPHARFEVAGDGNG